MNNPQPLSGEFLPDDAIPETLLPILATDMPTPLVKAMEVGRPLARAFAGAEPFSRGKWALYSAATHHDWLKADVWRFIIWWGGCGLLAIFVVLFALYDVMRVIREERDGH